MTRRREEATRESGFRATRAQGEREREMTVVKWARPLVKGGAGAVKTGGQSGAVHIHVGSFGVGARTSDRQEF